MGDRTCQLIYAVMHVCLESAVRKDVIGRNYMDAVEKPKVEHARKIVTLSPEQAQQLMIAAERDPHTALYHFAITTGMRESEISVVKWSDIHWEHGAVKVQRQVQRVDGQGMVFAEPKTQSGNRTNYLGPATLLSLQAHRERQAQAKELAGSRWVDHDLVFPTTIGTPRDPHNLLKEFTLLLQRAGLPPMRFHDLRHTSITLLLNEMGAPIKEAQHRAGHASPTTTLQIYEVK